MAKAKKQPKKMLAVFGKCRRVGRWRLAMKSVVLAVFGTCFLDLREAVLDGDDPIQMKLTVVFGSVRILLPSGAEILPSGMVVLADSRVEVPPADDSPFPLLEMEWTCVMGRLRVVSADVMQADDEYPTFNWMFWKRKQPAPVQQVVAQPAVVQAAPAAVQAAPVQQVVAQPTVAQTPAPVAQAAPAANVVVEPVPTVVEAAPAAAPVVIETPGAVAAAPTVIETPAMVEAPAAAETPTVVETPAAAETPAAEPAPEPEPEEEEPTMYDGPSASELLADIPQSPARDSGFADVDEAALAGV